MHYTTYLMINWFTREVGTLLWFRQKLCAGFVTKKIRAYTKVLGTDRVPSSLCSFVGCIRLERIQMAQYSTMVPAQCKLFD
jgi:hypothetical protein